MSLFQLPQPDARRLRQSLIKNLLTLAMADGALDRRELRHINDKALEYGLTPEELRQIFTQPRTIALVVPPTYEERVRQLVEMADYIAASPDRKPAEVRLCKRLAERFGFMGEVIDHLLAQPMGYDAALARLRVFQLA